jgi:predicted Rossmann fold flavoprotein
LKTLENTADILIVGGGAAGFFAAIHAKATKPHLNIVIAEKSDKLLSKVLISGGGRCNVTYNEPDLDSLLTQYPRGRLLLKWVLRKWGVVNTIRWFESHGVELKTEEDGRMFPISDDSKTIASALLNAADQLGITVLTKKGVRGIQILEKGFNVIFTDSEQMGCKKLVIATGGFPKLEQFGFLSRLGIEINPPVPSLFTFNIPDPELHELQGVSSPWGRVKIKGIEGWFEGPVLITHWGISGPGVLKTSAFLARELNALNYEFTAIVDWTGMGEEQAREHFISYLLMNSPRQIINANPFSFPKKLWEYLINKVGIEKGKLCRDLNKAEKNKLLELCIRTECHASGKTTFKQEFVTSGGVLISEIDANTMQSKNIPGLYFAGEVVDIDGVTGGFNFQAAWATGYIAGSSAAK